MLQGRRAGPIKLFSTCPTSSTFGSTAYLDKIIEVARWSEAGGCEGILVYTDNSLLDPWLVSQVIIQHTERLCPLVAVQPIYMHPYTVAKMVTSFGDLYQRRIYLNMVAGGFLRDLKSLNDDLDHDDRYVRLVEYTTVIRALLGSAEPVTFRGDYFTVDRLKMSPQLPAALHPGLMVSGSSVAGMAAARSLGATAVQYPLPAAQYASQVDVGASDTGIRIGIIARPTSVEAWDVAWSRFPGDRAGQLTHALAMKSSDSVWHQQLSQLSHEADVSASPYWLHPFENYKTFCPYLVGSYDDVAQMLAHYLGLGFGTFILDIPQSGADFEHIGVAFQAALEE